LTEKLIDDSFTGRLGRAGMRPVLPVVSKLPDVCHILKINLKE